MEMKFIYTAEQQNDAYDGVWHEFDTDFDLLSLFDECKGNSAEWITDIYHLDDKFEPIDQHVYIYHTKDQNNNYTVPRILIVIENNQICEIRGVAKGKNLEPILEDILEDKLESIPYKNTLEYTFWRLKMLYAIREKQIGRLPEPLDESDIQFLIDDDMDICYFGNREDPLYDECRRRITIDDLNEYFRRLYTNHGNFNLHWLKDAKGLKLPEHYHGNLYLNGLESLDGLILPDDYRGNLIISNIESTEKISLPKDYQGKIYYKDKIVSFASDNLLEEKRILTVSEVADIVSSLEEEMFGTVSNSNNKKKTLKKDN